MESFEQPISNNPEKFAVRGKRFIQKGDHGFEKLVQRDEGLENVELVTLRADDPALDEKKKKLLGAGWMLVGQGEHVVFEKEMPNNGQEFHA